MTRLFSFMMILVNLSLVHASCDRHNIETIYGAYNNAHYVMDLKYAIDTSTFDMVVGGDAGLSNTSLQPFLYLIDETSCDVSWHLLFDNTQITSFETLAIRSKTGKVYGSVQSSITSGQPTLFMEIHTTLLEDEPIVVKFFDLNLKNPSISIAPLSSDKIFMMSWNSVMSLTTANNRAWQNNIGARDGIFIDMLYNQGSSNLHLLQVEDTREKSKMSILKFGTGLSSGQDLASIITLNFAEKDLILLDEPAKISVSTMSNGNDLVSACALTEDAQSRRQLGPGHYEISSSTYMNIWSLETQDNSIVVDELNFHIDMGSILSCDGVSSSQTQSHVVLFMDDGKFQLISVSPTTLSNYKTTTSTSNLVSFLDSSTRQITFLDGLKADQFWIGGVYMIGEGHQQLNIGAVLNFVDNRVSSLSSLWSSTQNESFELPTQSSAYEAQSEIDRVRSDGLIAESRQLSWASSVYPIDNNEYVQRLFKQEATVTDVESSKSLQLNLTPQYNDSTEVQIDPSYIPGTIYYTFGMKIEELLPQIVDYERDNIFLMAFDDHNLNLNIWGVMQTDQSFIVFSEELIEGQNAEKGLSQITVSFFDDSETFGAYLNYTINIEILDLVTYTYYERLGLVTHSSIVIGTLDDSGGRGQGPDGDRGGQEGGGGSKGGSEGGEGGEEGGKGGEKGGKGGEKGGEGGEEGGQGGKGSSSSSESGQTTETIVTEVCEKEIYYEEYETEFESVSSVDDLIKNFMHGYGTIFNYLRVYGGLAIAKESDVLFDKQGILSVPFSRPVVFPTELIKEYNTDYVAQIPKLEPTNQELAKIKALFDEIEKTKQDEAESGVKRQVEKTREVCKDVEKTIQVDNQQSSNGQSQNSEGKGSASDQGGNDEQSGGGGGGKSDSGSKGGKRRLSLVDIDQQFQPGSFDRSLSLKQRLQIEIKSNGELDDETADEVQQYTWKIIGVTPERLDIQLSFKFPGSISADANNPQFVQVKAQFNDFEPGWINELVLVNKKLPKQKEIKSESQQAEAENAEGMASSLSNSSVAVIVTNILASGSVTQIWGMINGMQIFSHVEILPADYVSFPTYTSATLKKILELTSFSIFDPYFEQLYDFIFPQPDSDGENLLGPAEEIGFESYYMVRNLGAIFLTFIIITIVPISMWLIMKPLKKRFQAVQRYSNNLGKNMRGNMLIRYILEACLDVGICIFLQIFYSDLNGGLRFDDYFSVLNSSATIILGIVCGLFLPFSLIFYLCNFANWGNDDFTEKYGTVFIGLKKNKKTSLIYLHIFLLRRIFFASVMIFAPEKFWLQIFVLLGFSYMQIFYLTICKPFLEEYDHRIELYNEYTTIVLTYLLLTFSIANTQEPNVYYDFAFLAVSGGNLLVHLYLLSRGSYREIKQKIQNCCCKTSKKAKTVHGDIKQKQNKYLQSQKSQDAQDNLSSSEKAQKNLEIIQEESEEDGGSQSDSDPQPLQSASAPQSNEPNKPALRLESVESQDSVSFGYVDNLNQHLQTPARKNSLLKNPSEQGKENFNLIESEIKMIMGDDCEDGKKSHAEKSAASLTGALILSDDESSDASSRNSVCQDAELSKEPKSSTESAKKLLSVYSKASEYL